ncbi:hypothetical protein P154DRAFT_336786 [Amniculicola lignicola CBS 123094]|uniref:Uncharacterized protein n=1 Tax=Amniculicola lignicola CBS 123094 TaxID=1392246 RepID=A0A6A5WW57_9PLEO|nr:hypothetical protein P154DRAFT_336786 [Amniculicola lignicola CBS 123094]
MAHEATDYLAIAVVLLQLLIATPHTIILVPWGQESSECCSTLVESLALVQWTLSRTALENMVTDIYILSNFRNTARALVSSRARSIPSWVLMRIALEAI